MKAKAENVKFVLFIVAALWVVHVINWVIDWALHFNLNTLGILPRTVKGLIGIIFSPFLHANLFHLIGNTIPLLVLSLLLVVFYEKIAPAVIGIVVLVGGGLVWLLGRSAVHIGASGVIYGIAAFLIVYGFIKKNVVSIILAVIVAVLYGGSMLSGLLPVRGFVSWESHLFSAVAGVFAAYSLRKQPDADAQVSGAIGR
jgi:membrane associated rhomboid family serine protease